MISVYLLLDYRIKAMFAYCLWLELVLLVARISLSCCKH